jgi:peptidoglycan/LPS O-acetylase OafA/YrhL
LFFFHSYENKVFNRKFLNEFVIGKTFRLFPLHVFMLGVFIFIYFFCCFLVIAGGKFLKQIVFVLSVISYVGWSLNNGFVKGEVLRGLSCFFSGCVAYCLYEKISNIQFGKAVFNFLEVGSLILSYVILTSSLDEKGILISLIFCLITIIFSFERGWLSSVLKIDVVLYLGKLSFSIYMIHAAIIFCLNSLAIIGSKFFGVELTFMSQYYLGGEIRYISLGNAFVDNFVFFGILSLIVFLSSLTYKFIELKGIDFGEKINKKLLQ